jgi:hypothetical protein
MAFLGMLYALLAYDYESMDESQLYSLCGD